MIRKFFSDVRGNYALMTAAAIVPIMGGLALAVDYTEMAKQRQETLNALDAAGIATARRIVEGGGTEDQIKAYAKDYFEANLGSVKPSNTILTVVLPQNNTGGGTLKLSAALKYAPYFYPTFANLIGKDMGDTQKLDFNATSEIKLKNTLEVALVLDNSGSMDDTGSGSGKKRMVLLKEAAKELVDTISAQAQSMKQISKPVQFAVVPFAASVNVGAANKTKTWMDLDGISPVHHENFDWTVFTASNKKVTKVGSIYYKKGSGWGSQENQKVTRLTLLDDIIYPSSRTWVPKNVCIATYGNGSCKTWQDQGQYSYTYAPYASWGGCVEARPYPYNVNDTSPSSSVPATYFVPMFAPDETDRKDSSNRNANGNWWSDDSSSTDDALRQRSTLKYFVAGAWGSSAAAASSGPNDSCTTTAITPLTDVSATAGVTTIKDAIDAMASNGATNVPEGMAWGWRVLSSGQPFNEGRSESEKGNDKVVIVLTDGANTYYTPTSLGYNDLAGNKSIYSAYGYTGKSYNSGDTRLFMNTSSSVGKTTYTNANYTTALNEQFATLCGNAKTAGVIVMTVSLDLSTTNTTENAQINALKTCSSDSRFRKDSAGQPVKLYWNTTGGSLAKTFKEIADELSNLRIVG
ncbi:MAG: pilus assembly protein [Rhizobiaceae bacterium]|nr:pilus assembly protein [Rhizobiaceae bacterium]